MINDENLFLDKMFSHFYSELFWDGAFYFEFRLQDSAFLSSVTVKDTEQVQVWGIGTPGTPGSSHWDSIQEPVQHHWGGSESMCGRYSSCSRDFKLKPGLNVSELKHRDDVQAHWHEMNLWLRIEHGFYISSVTVLLTWEADVSFVVIFKHSRS